MPTPHPRDFAALLLCVILVTVSLSASWPVDAGASSPRKTLGVYRGAANPRAVAGFERWLGRPLSYSLDYFAADDWTKIEDPGWWLNGWLRAKPRRRMIYSVPMLPATGGTLHQGATGAYNNHFRRLARRLVHFRQGHAALRLGWEFNGGWYCWAAASSPAGFAEYWRQIVRTMRSVRGAEFKFDWNPTLGWEQFPADLAYPGDAYVDYIGLDVYDQSWLPGTEDPAARWNAMLTQPYGLAWHRDFAAAHGKPMTFPEWGVTSRSDGHGGGDNPYYVARMYDWIAANDVAYNVYFEFDAADGNHELIDLQFPQAAAMFRHLFGGVGARRSTVFAIPLTALHVRLVG